MARMKNEANGITIEISHGSCVGLYESRDNYLAYVFELVDSKDMAPNV